MRIITPSPHSGGFNTSLNVYLSQLTPGTRSTANHCRMPLKTGSPPWKGPTPILQKIGSRAGTPDGRPYTVVTSQPTYYRGCPGRPRGVSPAVPRRHRKTADGFGVSGKPVPALQNPATERHRRVLSLATRLGRVMRRTCLGNGPKAVSGGAEVPTPRGGQCTRARRERIGRFCSQGPFSFPRHVIYM